MAKDRSPDGVGERTMFAPDAAPFTLTTAQLRAHASPDGKPFVPALPVDQGVALPPLALRGGLAFWRSRAQALWPNKTVIPTSAATARAVRLAVATELDRGVGFILAPVLLAVGTLIYFSLRHEPGFLPLVAGAFVLGLMVVGSRARSALHLVSVAALLCVFGALLAKAETWRAGTKMLGGEVTTQLTGRVAEVERLANGRVRLTIDVTGTERPVLRYAPDRVRVSARGIPDSVGAGAAVTGLVRLMPPSGPVRPDSYDFSFESYFDGIGASGFFLRGPELATVSGPAPPLALFRASVERARSAIATRIQDRIGGAEGEIAAALVVGVRAGIPEDVNEAQRRAGIYHIISISGLHMALVAGTIMVLLRAGFAFFPDFSSRHAVKKYAAALAFSGSPGTCSSQAPRSPRNAASSCLL